jgi:hypothetical protein
VVILKFIYIVKCCAALAGIFILESLWRCAFAMVLHEPFPALSGVSASASKDWSGIGFGLRARLGSMA